MIHIEYINNLDNLENFNSNNHNKICGDTEVKDLDYRTELNKTNLSQYMDLINYPVIWTYEFNLFESKILLEACHIGCISGKFPKIYSDELFDIINRLNESWVEGLWFMRLDTCSPKDSSIKLPYKTPLDVITSIVTSKRVINGFLYNIDNNQSTKIYFIKYNDKWDSNRELRCFVRKKKLTAISQYCWTTCEFFCDFSHQELVNLATIINHYIGQKIDIISAKINTEDVVFDIYLDQDNNLRIIELNSFGYWLASGSALFHWIKDYDKLYNTNNDVYFRILKIEK
ncbi:division cycle 123 protein [Megavirus baoshan]|uniref:Division cycle 123 protein n=1 Tax=Megavirus baoshan TaxID=2496520 RepID=A0A3S8UYH4_9VIRU|nr:division cycle 123 protein [Megavirus baoshan]AZL89824.1 division cycle 123 protein [Megavirus baoshan]